MGFNPFKEKPKENKKNESKKEISDNSEVFKEKFSSLKFPADFEVKLTKDASEDRPIHFLVKKEGAPNEVSVIGIVGYHGEDSMEWEVASKTDNSSLGGIRHVRLENTDEALVKTIEENLYLDPSDERDEEYLDHEEDESLEFGPSRCGENEFRTEYSEMLTKASNDKEKNREIIDDIMEMEHLLGEYYYIPEEETYPDFDSSYIDKLNTLRQKYNLPKLYIIGSRGRLSQHEE